MKNKIQKFLRQHNVMEGPLLLGYSGGVDSTVLLSLMRQCQLDVHVIHVNHGWRANSLEQAGQLQQLVHTYNIPFYLETITTIDPNIDGNLEDRYRQERLKIFQKYYHKIGAKALLLAHQKNDQAETVFKRIFEGASLGKLVGLKESNEIEGMRVLRPLLSFTKEEIYSIANKNHLTFIEDETNMNVHYLRARQRVEIFPEIERKFGKNASHNLCRLGHTLSRYTDYMKRKITKYHQEMVQGPLGICLNLNNLHPIEELELEYFIRTLCEEYECRISYDALMTLVRKIQEGATHKRILVPGGEWIVDRGYLFFLYPTSNEWTPTSIQISQLPHHFTYQGIRCKLEERKTLDYPISWQQSWMGIIEFVGSEETLTLSAPDLSYPVHNIPLREVYSHHKIPICLRERLPHIFQGNTLCCNLLTPLHLPHVKDQKIFRLSLMKSLNKR